MRFIATILLLPLTGCFAESYWVLAPNSPLPGGLLNESRMKAVQSPHIEIWFYTDGAVMQIFENHHIFKAFELRVTSRQATPAEAPVAFFVTVNEVESGYKHVEPENSVFVVK